MTGWKSTAVDIDSLQGVDVLDTTGHALAALATNAAFGGALPLPSIVTDGMELDIHPEVEMTSTGRKKYRPECSLYLGYWICAVCFKVGLDFRREFCPFGMAGVI
jgi:hypothetical protein